MSTIIKAPMCANPSKQSHSNATASFIEDLIVLILHLRK